MTWLIAAVSAYFILAVVFLIDKYLLSGRIPNPKMYCFYVGILNSLAVFLIFFVNFYIPSYYLLFLSLISGALFIFSLFWLYKALFIFEVSRVIPTVGGLLPLFSFSSVYIFSGGKESLGIWGLLAFFFLVVGSVLITYKKTKMSLRSFLFSALSAFLLSLSFVLSKYVYLKGPFWVSFIWIKIGGGIFALVLLFLSREVRESIKRTVFSEKKVKKRKSPKTAAVFITNQVLGGGAHILQNYSFFLAPSAIYISLINALQGTQYLFLFIFALIISLKFPQVIKEEVSKKIIIQKLLAILLIGVGIGLLAVG